MCKEKLLVYCPICKTYKPHQKFQRKKKSYKQNWTCNNCHRRLNRMLAIVDEILEGVKIPYYETPVTKYKITDQMSDAS